MAFPRLDRDPDIEGRIRSRRRIRNVLIGAVLAVTVIAGVQTWRNVTHEKSTAHVATKTVTVISAERKGDDVHVRARLDAPSPAGTSHELEGVVPASTWNLTKVLWACYPPSDPDRGELRTPLDPDCTNFVTNLD